MTKQIDGIPMEDIEPPTITLKTGSPARRVKNRIGFEMNVPRCDNCRYFSKAKTELFNSIPVRFFAQCKKFKIQCHENAVCNEWKGKDGSFLS
jgi:hypothetical protein